MKEELIGTQEASLGSWRGPFHLLKEMRSWEELCPEVGPTIGIEGQCSLTCCRRRSARAAIRLRASSLRFCALGILLRAGACRQKSTVAPSKTAPSRATRSNTTSG